MIIANGHIEFKSKEGGGIDPVTGYPLTPAATWQAETACQYVPTRQNLQAQSQGEPTTQQTYAIFIEGYDGCAVAVGEQLRLKDNCGHLIGEFSVTSVTPLLAVDETRIDV